MAVRSAQSPDGKAAFSWLAPVTSSPFPNRKAAPTWNPLYGAYEWLVASTAFCTSRWSSLLSSSNGQNSMLM
jgi:hypothetical protein